MIPLLEEVFTDLAQLKLKLASIQTTEFQDYLMTIERRQQNHPHKLPWSPKDPSQTDFFQLKPLEAAIEQTMHQLTMEIGQHYHDNQEPK